MVARILVVMVTTSIHGISRSFDCILSTIVLMVVMIGTTYVGYELCMTEVCAVCSIVGLLPSMVIEAVLNVSVGIIS